ncbi:Os02g0142450 [Oryza sativa Japonica Group]|uniref:Os02g0142450 protein n=1 Tax=Oryza sativa subsp. japonica TaxID=39947 RepID=A0A0P0VER9_ORYSJ|nr:hypothetical protein EE612_008803 [Oryza sativa]BAS76933.1 Os02g0142450 [Oryza sativa Japonica Group]
MAILLPLPSQASSSEDGSSKFFPELPTLLGQHCCAIAANTRSNSLFIPDSFRNFSTMVNTMSYIFSFIRISVSASIDWLSEKLNLEFTVLSI